jgi:hypothetical protein
MARAGDFVCAIAIGPTSALVAIIAGLLAARLAGATASVAILMAVAVFALMPPTTIVLRARVRGLELGWTCLLLLITVVSMATTLGAMIIAMSLVYAYVMRDF